MTWISVPHLREIQDRRFDLIQRRAPEDASPMATTPNEAQRLQLSRLLAEEEEKDQVPPK